MDLTPDAAVTSLNLLRAVVTEKLDLNDKGFGLCPFHDEKTPSFNIFQAQSGRARFHCFGCGAGGDVFNFLKTLDGLNFRAALVYLGTLTDRRAAFSVSELSAKTTGQNSGGNGVGHCVECPNFKTLADEHEELIVENGELELRLNKVILSALRSWVSQIKLREYVLKRAKAGDAEAQAFVAEWTATLKVPGCQEQE